MQLFPVRAAIYMRRERERDAVRFPENISVAGYIGKLPSLPIFILKRGIFADDNVLIASVQIHA